MQALPRTIAWYQSQDEWLQRVRSGAYREYYTAQYGWLTAREGPR